MFQPLSRVSQQQKKIEYSWAGCSYDSLPMSMTRRYCYKVEIGMSNVQPYESKP